MKYISNITDEDQKEDAMKKKRILSALLSAMFLSCSFAGLSVRAAETAPLEETAAGTPTEEAASPDPAMLTDEELAQYYNESVFVGDSIMVGFRNHCTKKKDSFMNGAQFLAVGSYSAANAIKPVTSKNIHPLYKGKKYQIWDAIPRMGVKRVFILLGMNDIAILGLEGARDQYEEVINKVVEACPDAEIHILSMTYTLKDAGTTMLNNKNIAKYNVLLEEMAQENGWDYINVTDSISDGKGNLDAAYCSDDFVHLSSAAYDVWETLFRDFANAQPKGAPETPETLPETGSEP